MKVLKTLQESSLFFECVISENESAFIHHFCWAPEDVIDLLSVYFNSSMIKFYYSIVGGDTVTGEASLDDFLMWARAVMPACG